jgi:hypothetical protein
MLKEIILTPIIAFQKGESVGFTWTCESVLPHRYLLVSNSCQTPFSKISL